MNCTRESIIRTPERTALRMRKVFLAIELGSPYVARLESRGSRVCGLQSVARWRLWRAPASEKVRKMAVPKRKVTGSRRGMRRSHDALKAVNYQEDSHTGEYKLRHHIDLKTGMYRGKQVLEPKGDY